MAAQQMQQRADHCPMCDCDLKFGMALGKAELRNRRAVVQPYHCPICGFKGLQWFEPQFVIHWEANGDNLKAKKVRIEFYECGVTEEDSGGFAVEMEVEEGALCWDIVQDYLKDKTLRHPKAWMLVRYRRPGEEGSHTATGAERAQEGDRILVTSTHIYH